MKTFAISLVSSVCVIAALALPQTARAQTVPLLFQTTFNCPDWNQTMGLGDANVCSTGDGISGNGAWTTTLGSVDQITAAANYSGGAGGKGFRHWIGDGTNVDGGGIRVSWTPASEIWIRLYVRFQSGFHFVPGASYHKVLYVNQGQSQGTFMCGLEGGFVGGHVELGGNHFSTLTFADWQSGGPDGDGLWHAFEVHAKMNLLGAVADGVIEFWLDGVQVYTNSSVKFATVDNSKFNFTVIGSNAAIVSNGGVDKTIDFDDIAISTTGYIGPTYGAPAPRTAAPRNLRVQ